MVLVAKSLVGFITNMLLPMMYEVYVTGVPRLSTSSTQKVLDFLMAWSKVTVNVLAVDTLVAPSTGFVAVMVGELPTLKVMLLPASGIPARSVTQPLCSISLYLDSAKSVVGVMVKMLPVMFVVNGMAVPLLFTSSIQKLLPSSMAWLNVTVIILSAGTLVAPLTGSVVVMVGGMLP